MPLVRFFDKEGHKQEQQDPDDPMKDEGKATGDEADEADVVTGHASGVATTSTRPDETPAAND